MARSTRPTGEEYLKRKGKLIGDAQEIGRDLLPGRSFQSCWKSVESFAKYVKSLNKNEAWCKSGWDGGEESFYGTKTMEEALDLAQNGWKEGTDAIDRARKKIASLRPRSVRLSQYDLVGVTPSIPRAVSGNPKNMRKPDNADAKKRKVITLISNFSALCNVDQAAITNRAAVVATLIDEIESTGYACEVVSTALSTGYNGFDYACSIRVKESNQPVDIKRLAFALGHAALFRRMTFADKGISSECREGLGSGLGCSEGFNNYADMLAQKNVYTLPSANKCQELFKTEEDAAKLGVEFFLEGLRRQKCPPFRGMKPSEDSVINAYLEREGLTQSYGFDPIPLLYA